jgi:signal transduction histidine kinase
MNRPLSVQSLKKQLHHTLWVPVLLMAILFLGAVAFLLYREQMTHAHSDRMALDSLLTSQRALIAQEVFLGQTEAVKLRLDGLLNDWRARGSQNAACLQVVLFPATARTQTIEACSTAEVSGTDWRDRAKQSSISVGDETLAEMRSDVVIRFGLKDLFPPLLIFIVFGAVIVAILVHSALVRRVEKAVLTPLLEKLTQEGRNAAIAETARMVAHDIRKPFQLLQLALVRLQTDSQQEVRELGEQLDADIHSTAQAVDSMLKDLLDVGKDFIPELKPVSVGRLVTHLKDTLQRLHPRASTQYIVDIPDGLVATADREHVLRVLLNLAENGLQAMEMRGSLTITAENSSDDHLTVAVVNTGPRIPKNHIENLFLPMFTTRRTGTGLGLAIAKRIVEKHGGRLWLDSSDGEKTIFKFTLKRHAGEVSAAPSEFSLQSEIQLVPVLIFENERFFRETWKDWATDHAASVQAYSSWEEFITSGDTVLSPETVALVDIHFEHSDHDGIDIARNLRQLGVQKLFAITSDPATASESKVFDKILGKVIPRDTSR